MRRTRFLGPALSVLALGAAAPGCATKVVGQIVLVVQTDLSLPKDIDTIRIEVSTEGVPKFKNDYDRLGSKDGTIHLPGTLALDAPDKPSAAISILVSARTGGKDGTVRVLREVVTTVPLDRSAELDMPIHFLCDGSGKVKDGEAVSTCPEGQSCVAGACKDDNVDSSKLPNYAPTKALGDGSCLDVTTCFDSSVPAVVDPKTCSLPALAGVNIALQTEGDGICGRVGCFVALDSGSEEGFTVAKDGTIALPPAVCDKIKAGTIVNVVTAPVTANCKQKTSSLPTCGPWSSASSNAPPYVGPLAIAGGQAHPVSIALGADGVLWTSGGAGAADGAIKSVSPSGGTPSIVAPMQAPRDLTLAGTAVLWTSAPPGAKMGQVVQSKGGSVAAIVSGLDVPEGLAAFGNNLFFTEFQGGHVFQAPVAGGAPIDLAQGNYPYRTVADATHVYWTNEGAMGVTPPDGSIARYDYADGGKKGVETLAMAQATPRAIALDRAGNGPAAALYWANFAEGGSIFRVDLSGATPGAPVEIAKGLSYPNGIAIDTNAIYWTNRGAGTVMSLAKSAAAGTAPTTLADGQNAPGTIVVDAASLYWINEGSSGAPNGAVIKLPKGP
jgi:hypothetical protein